MSAAASSGDTGGDDGSMTLSGLIATLVPVLILSGVFFAAFLILRRLLPRNYEPRTFMLREQERSPRLSRSLFGWLPEMMKIQDTYVLNHQSIDGYLLLRFLRVSVLICFVGCCITWPVLFPVNATGGNGQQQLNLLGFSNIKQEPQNPRLYAHTFISWIFFSFIWYTIARETIYYVNLRQAYLLSPLYANRISSRTVIYSSVPSDFLNGAKIRRLFGPQLKNYWIATDCKDLQKLVDERDKVAYKLEAAETKLIKMANNARIKSAGKNAPAHEEPPANIDGESGSAAAKWVPTNKRPTHRLKPLVGKKVDTINWCRQELERLIPEVDALQAKHKAGDVKFVNSIIVEFHSQADAQAAYQTTTHHQPLHMAPRYIGVNPEGVIWKNLRILWWERVIRNAASIAFVCALIVFWAIPVAFVGFLSNIQGLIHGTPGHPPVAPWLSFLEKIPPQIFGVITGLLPSVLLAVLMALLPIILRLAAKLGGAISTAEVELKLQNYYFAFQVIQVFLVATLGSTATSVIQKISADPSSTPGLLAAAIPKASNLYISYFIVQGLTFASGALLQLVGIILFRVLGKFLDSTPRKMYKRWMSLSSLGWGTVFPIYSLLTTIAIIYSCLSPLLLGFATVGLYLFYIAFRYNLLFVFNVQVDTKGLVYPRALQHITVGIYIGIIVMIGIFSVSLSAGPAVLMVLYLIFSILFHISLRSAVAPLLNTLPRSLAVEEEDLLSAEEGAVAAGAEKNGSHTAAEAKDDMDGPAPEKKAGIFARYLHPGKYSDYKTLRKMVPRNFADVIYTEEIETHAYYHPAVAADTPTLWVPKDSMGISAQEIAHTNRIIPISDHGATFDDKGKITWDDSNPETLPIYSEKIYY